MIRACCITSDPAGDELQECTHIRPLQIEAQVLCRRMHDRTTPSGAPPWGDELMSSLRYPPDYRVELKQARMRLARLKKNLERLMPFDEWCGLVKPSESAQETYHFVRHTLLTRIREAQACVRCLTAQRPHPGCPAALQCSGARRKRAAASAIP